MVWGNRITMDNGVERLLSENRFDELVEFTFINVKTGKESTKEFTLDEAINLAEYRREDKRYKNFEFHISEIVRVLT